ncbi:MAG: dephospho-CoA kinase [Verrucomicrobiaceae bacterium]|nr:dephospho-CoA kinase [Verrucomicrobiaceae bacterium]
MFVVGVTGGIGSGKTAVTNIFAALGIDIVDADVVSRIVVEPGTPALKKIAAHFGASILQTDGALNRAALRQIVFKDLSEKTWLEQLLHPLIAQETQSQLQQATSPYVIFVSPLLAETAQKNFCDRLLVIDVSEDMQLQRTMTRDSNSAEQVQRIMAAQICREARLRFADDVIENNGTQEQLHEQVLEMHQRYLILAKQKPNLGN